MLDVPRHVCMPRCWVGGAGGGAATHRGEMYEYRALQAELYP